MTYQGYFVGALALVSIACETTEPAETAAPTTRAPAEEPSDLNLAEPLDPGTSRELLVDGKRYLEEGRRTSSGELTRALVPVDVAPTVVVPVGARCGVKDAQGALLSCQTGSACVSAGEGQPGICEAPPQAPRWDG